MKRQRRKNTPAEFTSQAITLQVVAHKFDLLCPVGTPIWYRGKYRTILKPSVIADNKVKVLLSGIKSLVPVSGIDFQERVALKSLRDLEDEVRKNIVETKTLRELVDSRHQTYEKSHTEYFTAITNFSDEHNKRCTNIENSFGSLEEKVEQFIRKLEPSNKVEAQEGLIQLLLKVIEKLVED